MKRFLPTRRTPVPTAVQAVATDERRLAWALTDTGVPLVAVGSGLYVGAVLLPWMQVEKATWKPDVLTITEVSEVEGAGLSRVFILAVDDRLAQTIRAQVTSSIGWSDRRKLIPDGAVRLVGRRVAGPGGAAEKLQWQVVWEAGTDRFDPSRQAQVEQHLEALRRTIG